MALSGEIRYQRDDNFITHTTIEQSKVEESVMKNYNKIKELKDEIGTNVTLLKSKHLSYLKKGLYNLSETYECLDASRPWLCFWIVHGLELLNEPFPEEICQQVSNFLDKCQDHEGGGFAGGPGQLAHLAPTYAAVSTLCILGRYWRGAYQIINRVLLSKFLMSCRTVDGSFIMHQDGEEDIRGVYCAIVVARLTNIYTKEMFWGTSDWLVKCQTYEGGFGGLPGLEAHGGYTFCGYAALALIGQEQKANTQRLLKWVASRQMKLEGGFQGRTNKMVDGCYSFWQGGLFPIIHSILQMHGDENLSIGRWMFNQTALEEYVLVNCQCVNGGLLDKPGKSRDFYHTCYCLSGLSVAEHFIGDSFYSHADACGGYLLQPLHPVYNISIDSAKDALECFKRLPIP